MGIRELPVRPENGQHFTADELEQLAKKELRYFTGPQTSNPTTNSNSDNTMAEAINPYIYSGWGLKNQGFGNEQVIRFQFDIINAANVALTAVLNCGYQNNHAYVKGLLKDGAFNDKSNTAGLSGVASSGKKLEDFQGFINRFPTRLKAIQLRTATAGQFSVPLIVKGINPFTAEGETPITFGDVQSQSDANDKVLNANLDDILEAPFFLGADKAIEYTIGANTTVSFTFYLGYVYHDVKAFEAMYKAFKQSQLANYVGIQ